MEALIEVKDLTKVYGAGNGAVHALRGINLTIPKGAFMMIQGPSGSGKSTLLNIIGFLDQASGGQVCYDGEPVTTTDFDTLAHMRSLRVGFVFQSFNLIPVLTARENVMVPLMIRRDLTASEKAKRVDAVLEAVGLADRAGQRPDELSGGQKQRVSIARAMVTEAPIVLADEPTASLDTENSMRVLDLMLEVSRKRGTAFIFSTHDPRVEKFARQRVRLVDGLITENTET